MTDGKAQIVSKIVAKTIVQTTNPKSIWSLRTHKKRRHLKRVVVLVALLGQVNAAAQIAVRATDFPLPNFRGQMKARIELESYVSHILENSPPKDKASTLLRLLERSQKAFLTGTLEEARAGFLQIVQLAHASDWKLSQRQAIFLAHLRAGQLTPSPQDRRDLLARAAVFASDLSPDPDLIAPPLATEFNTVKRELKTRATTVEVHPQLSEFDVLLLNGRTFLLATNSTLSLLPGTYRVTLLSNGYQPRTQVLTNHQLATLKPVLSPIVEGTCENPKLANNSETFPHYLLDRASTLPQDRARQDKKSEGVFVFYQDDCVQILQNGRWQRLSDDSGSTSQLSENKGPNADFLETSSPSENWKLQPYARRFDEHPTQLFSPGNFERQASRQPIYKQKWFWMTVSGVAAAAAIVHHNRQRESGPQSVEIRPTQQTGY